MAASSFESDDEERDYDLESFLLEKQLENDKSSSSSSITGSSAMLSTNEEHWQCTIKFEMAKTTDVGHIVFQVQDAQTVIETLPAGLLTEGAILVLEGPQQSIRELAIWRNNSWTICNARASSSSEASLSSQESLAALKVLSLLSEKYQLLQRIFWYQTPAGVMKERGHYSIDERHQEQTLLHETIKHLTLSLDEKKYILNLLIAAGSNIEAATNRGATPFYIAAYSGYRDIAQLLLTHGANKEATHRDGTPPLIVAARNGHRDIVELLLTHGANKDAATHNGITSLYIAAQNGHWQIVRLLLTHGADKDAALKDGATPLFIAAQNGYREIVELLLIHGANKEAAYKKKYPPIHVARRNNHQEIVTLLNCPAFESLYPLLSPSTPIPSLYGAILSKDLEQVQRCLLEGASLPSANIRFFDPPDSFDHYINRYRFMTTGKMIATHPEAIVLVPTLKVLVYMALLKNEGLPSWFCTISPYLTQDFLNFEIIFRAMLARPKEYPLSEEDREKFSLSTKRGCSIQ